ncbi:periodic tryptophan protein 2 [Dorcoceras hygrometricum]|uniref:Periodic tryptophan protein 2 n=1 Tax=Dorcoceras hygrometricum TaxID=472368 RepID=A0A2Z7BY41_9LAMI|nr:periodic tryptophan protein 2 [Dorcoceras hygrometricum]
MNYRFQNLLGAPYRGGNVVVVNNTLLISPVGNRVSVTDLLKSETITLPCQASTNLRHIAASADGLFVFTVDENNRCLFINLPRRVVLHRISFKHRIAVAKFSPDGRFIAVSAGKLLQIWRSPGFKKEFFPFELIRTFADCNDRITCLDWSPDSDYVIVGSKDLTLRLFCLKKMKNFKKPFLLLGHRDVIVGAFFGVDRKTNGVICAYSLSRDGAVFRWGFSEAELDSPGTPEQRQEQDLASGNQTILKKRKESDGKDHEFDGGDGVLLHRMKWALMKKDYLMQAPAKLTSCDYHRGLDMVVVGLSNGVFALYQMPDFVCIHLLSISREKITTATFNGLGNWLTFGCAKLGQLLVWEWKSESYILKQQGHYFDVNCLAYSSDSQLLATGADDNKIKATLHFMASKNCLLSASLDGTVRAYDLFRYRNFKIFVTPTPKQFVSLTSDQSGDIICAGTLDSFEIFVWSMKDARLLDVLSGHEGPVHGLMFSPTQAILASSSWDKSVRLWDIFEGKGGIEKFDHTHDVLTVVYRPDGKQMASSTLDGQIHFWDSLQGLEMFTIEGRRDIAGGRLMTDRRSASNSSAGKCFTTLCYSSDGSYILAGGNSKYICITEAGPVDLIDDDDSDIEEELHRLAGVGQQQQLKGVLLYSMDDTFIFDPTDLDMDVTPEAVDDALKCDQPKRALFLSLRMNEDTLIKKCILTVAPLDISDVASSVPVKYLQRLVEALADLLENCPHLEFILRWCQELCKFHGTVLQQNSTNLRPALRTLQNAVTRLRKDLADTCSSNEYMLRYLCSTSNKR